MSLKSLAEVFVEYSSDVIVALFFQWSDARRPCQGRGAGVFTLLTGLPGVALPHRGHHR